MRRRGLFAATWLLCLLRAMCVSGQAPDLNRKWDLGVWASGATGEEQTNGFSEAQILTAGVYAGRMLTGETGHGWRRGYLEYGFDLAPLFLQFSPHRIRGTAFDPVIFRWHSTLNRRVAPFLELGGGGVRTTVDFPLADTSSFNFMARGGGGVQIGLTSRQAFEIGCRWWHISNANLGVRNPEFNGIQFSVGYHWRE